MPDPGHSPLTAPQPRAGLRSVTRWRATPGFPATHRLGIGLLLLTLLIGPRSQGAGTGAGAAADTPVFSRDILPLLSDHCFSCHGPDEGTRKGGLRLDTHEGALGAGKSGSLAVSPGHSTKSELIRRITTLDPDDLMPPAKSKKPLSPAQIELLTRWVDSGAAWGRHWAYETPRRPALPTGPFLPEAAPTTHPIDLFIRARLAREKLEPSPEAPRETLIRRVTLDLTGLPPNPRETAEFLADAEDGAFKRVVERLLASPRYGERMAWEWLEAARYADSNGYQGDGERTMWPWRDWVVEAFNRNLPFDQFTLWQLAGDLLPEPTFEQRLATGFLRNHAINGEGGRIAEENRVDYLFDQTETLGTVWLGATLNCTRCHNHKFDPVTQRDYYGLLAYFNRTAIDGAGGDPQSKPNLEVPSPEQATARRDLDRRVAETATATADFELKKFPRPDGRPPTESTATNGLPAEILGHLALAPRQRDGGRLEKLAAHWKDSDPAYSATLSAQRKAQADRDAVVRAIPRVMVMEDIAQARETFIYSRGLYTQPGARTTAAVPPSLTPFDLDTNQPPNRLTLARWLLDPNHPLTARVTVNRLWQSFFGTGLVKTAEDFGVQGERPSHPELLDWLATEFIASDWDVKHLVRLIVTSATYRQSSKVDPARIDRDPENRLLSRGPRFRMPSWMIRDHALAAAGLLSDTVGGAPVRPYQPAGVWEEATFGNKRYVQDHGEALYRRSLYVFWRRIVGPTMFFDTANRQTCTVRTPRTNVPLHALLTLNDTTYLEAARALAQRLLQTPDLDAPARLDLAARRVLNRSLESEERTRLVASLARHRSHFEKNPDQAARLLATGESPRNPAQSPTELATWTLISHTLLNLDEALSKE